MAYAQYSHDTERLGALVRVLPGLHPVRPTDLGAVVAMDERFFTFFPVAAAASQGIVRIVGNQEVPERKRSFPLMRMRGSIDKSGRVLDWWLYDGNREWRIGQLGPGQEKLSLAEIWNDTLLVERILSNWVPSMVVSPSATMQSPAHRRPSKGDAAAIEELERAGSHVDAPHELRHYLYFPEKRSAEATAGRLAQLGFEVSVLRREDQWAVIARHKLVPSAANLENVRQRLEKVAEDSGGEYDGWEAATVR
ncbi:MAG: ribonuclease E inhibitor RraB [Actinomycetota bacterium]|nr:ribonuclease E inhibitor RraB [Actinomycetota bacterium]